MIRFNNNKSFVFSTLLAVTLITAISCEAVHGKEEEFEKKDKTLLIYFAANNNLASSCDYSIRQLTQGYIPSDNGNLIIYTTNTNDPANPVLIHIKGENNKVILDTVYRFPTQISTLPSTLTSVMNVTKTLFPADEMSLILWSHGTGWLPQGYYSNPETKSFGYDYDGVSSDAYEMEIIQLASAIPYELSFIIFDACLMGGIEVEYELKDVADYIIASPTEILTSSFPYDKIIEHIFKEKSDLVAVAQEYYNYYSSSGEVNPYATISLVDCSKLEDVAQSAKSIIANNRSKIKDIDRNKIQQYFRSDRHWFYDLKDFLAAIAEPGEIENFDTALNNAVIYKAATQWFFELKIDPEHFCGLSSNIPTDYEVKANAAYAKLLWNQDVQLIETE